MSGMSLVLNQAKPLAARVALVLWALALCAVCGTYLGSHLVALPQPETRDPRLLAAVAAHREPGAEPRWAVYHALYGECPCSRKIADTLMDPDRPRPADLDETVLLVGADAALKQRVLAAGFAVEELTMEELSPKWGIAAAPLMVVADPAGEVRYVGGYTSRKQGPDVRDLAILEDLRSDAAVVALPLFGCAVSDTLRAMADPLGIR